LRQINFRIEPEDLKRFIAGEKVETKATDNAGGQWSGTIRQTPLDPFEGSPPMAHFEVREIPLWAIYIEGAFIGVGANDNPGDAVHDAFRAAGLTSLPEAVEVKAVGADGGIFMVFTLSGTAYCVPLKQFTEDVAKSGNWVSTRQARRPEIDALMEEIKRLPKP
jgi:hypothetical protein